MSEKLRFLNRTKREATELEALVRTAANGVIPGQPEAELIVAFETRPNRGAFGNFRTPVHPVRFFDLAGALLPFARLAIHPARLSERTGHQVDTALSYLFKSGERGEADYLEESCTPDRSVVGHANSAYWSKVDKWPPFGEQLRTGESDSVNKGFWKDRTQQIIVPRLKLVDSQNELPDQVAMLELGAAGGETTKVILDTLEDAAIEDPTLDSILRKAVVYLADYSQASLDAARERFVNSKVAVKVLNGDVIHPKEAFPEIAGDSLVFVHAGNLLDNLPTRRVAKQNGKYFEERVALFLDSGSLRDIALNSKRSPAELRQLFLTIIDPAQIESIPCDDASIDDWQLVWRDAVRFEEDYHQIDPTGYNIVPGPQGLNLDEVLHIIPEGGSAFLSDHAAQTLGNVLNVLHPDGVFQAVDIFKGTDYIKLAGSFYTAVTEPILSVLARNRGLETTMESFSSKYNPESRSDIFTVGRGLNKV